MRPELLRLPDWLGGQPVPSYGAFLLLGVVAGAWAFSWLAGRAGADRLKALQVALEAALVGLLASKLGGWLLAAGALDWDWRRFVTGGGVWYFGLLAGSAHAALRGRVLGLPLLEVADCFAPAVALGHALGRVGCFLAGCCWGRSCSWPWAVRYPVVEEALRTGVPAGVPIHPVPLYEAGLELLFAAVLAAWILAGPRSAGRVALAYLSAYALARLALETLRADPRGAVGPISTSQAIALVVLGLSLLAQCLVGRREGARARPAPTRSRGP